MINLSCETIDVYDQNFNLIKDDDSGFKLYKIQLSKYQEIVSELFEFLTPLEQDRANRYHFKKDRNKFVICRVLLKFILAEHLDVDIQKVVIKIDNNRKPYCSLSPKLFFNVTHTHNYALIVVAKHDVGVDIEYINKDFDYELVLRSVLHNTEIDKVVHSKNKYTTFFKFWTRKEAIVKAIGKGIDDSLSDIIVLDGARRVPENILGSFKTITVFSFEPNKCYIASVALTSATKLVDRILFHPIPHAVHLLLNKK